MKRKFVSPRLTPEASILGLTQISGDDPPTGGDIKISSSSD